MSDSTIVLAACCAIFAVRAPSAAEALPEGVRLQEHKRWPDCPVLTAPEAKLKVVVVPAIGGRIVHYGPEDANIIFEVPGSDGKTLANHKGWFWVGGYQCDLGPEIRGLPGHDTLWLGPYSARAAAPYAVNLASEPDAVTGIQLEKEIKLDPKTGALTVVQRMMNISDKETRFCLWDRTLCVGGGFAFFPLNRKSRFPAGWCLRVKPKGDDAYRSTDPALPNVKVLDGVLVVECKGKDGKLGADSDAGWIGYARGKQLYLKTFPVSGDGLYSDGGNTVEVYWSNQVGEIEPLSPERTLKPGERFEFTEQWALLALPEEITSFEAARALVDQAAAAADGLRKAP